METEKDNLERAETAPLMIKEPSSLSELDIFLKEFELKTESEARLDFALHFMESALANGDSPQFRLFWEARRHSLPLFKEILNPSTRTALWDKYTNLSKEARRLKELLDEQSSFAAEQIDLAIQSLESELAHFDEGVEKLTLLEEATFPKTLDKDLPFYTKIQRELHLLNLHALKVNALRKELLRTEMRVGVKNKLFQKLSSVGDAVFPRRKELIKNVSKKFIEDVEGFVALHFGEASSKESPFFLRDEIKMLQALAKVLTLNTHAFTQTRTRLSQLWDRLKEEEKERRKERSEQKNLFKANQDLFFAKIAALTESLEKGEINALEADKRSRQISGEMREVELGREEVRALKDELAKLTQRIDEKERENQVTRIQQQEELERQKRERVTHFEERASELLMHAVELSPDAILQEREHFLKDLRESKLSKVEKQEIELLLKPLRDLLTEKKEKSLLSLSKDEKEALFQLQEILEQRRESRAEIKANLEALKKNAAGFGLDFDRAMRLNGEIAEEKERFEKANRGVAEIEEKIADLQGD